MYKENEKLRFAGYHTEKPFATLVHVSSDSGRLQRFL
jgi:hypothetical protein